MIAKKAHLILPTHQLLDAAYESNMGDKKIGSTLKGIGPTYTDKIGRKGLRVGDTSLPDFDQKYQRIKEQHIRILEQYNYDYSDLAEREAKFFAAVELLKNMPQVDA
ncbi:Adenylosuccinate synthetase [compost metagenome]